MEVWSVNLLGTVIAFFATLIGSFSGGGSALILFPALLMFAPYSYVSLLTVSKTSAAIMTFVAGKIHFRKNILRKDLLLILTISGLFGTAIGTYLVQHELNEALNKAVMGAIMILSSVYIIFVKTNVKSEISKINTLKLTLAGIAAFLLNILNGMFGGTGLLLTTFLIFILGASFIESVAYTMISYAIVNTTQAAYLLATEEVSFGLLFAVMIGAIVGSYLGTHLQYLKGNSWAKIASALVMIVIGVKMLFSF